MRGANNVWLDTFGFQAEGFYRKLGYRAFGRLDAFHLVSAGLADQGPLKMPANEPPARGPLTPRPSRSSAP